MAIPFPTASPLSRREGAGILSPSKDPCHCEERSDVAIPFPTASPLSRREGAGGEGDPPVHPEPVEGPVSLRGAPATWQSRPQLHPPSPGGRGAGGEGCSSAAIARSASDMAKRVRAVCFSALHVPRRRHIIDLVYEFRNECRRYCPGRRPGVLLCPCWKCGYSPIRSCGSGRAR